MGVGELGGAHDTVWIPFDHSGDIVANRAGEKLHVLR